MSFIQGGCGSCKCALLRAPSAGPAGGAGLTDSSLDPELHSQGEHASFMITGISAGPLLPKWESWNGHPLPGDAPLA